MENNTGTFCDGGAVTQVPVPEDRPLPIVQFLTGNILPGCGMEEAKALTRMMEMAYSKI